MDDKDDLPDLDVNINDIIAEIEAEKSGMELADGRIAVSSGAERHVATEELSSHYRRDGLSLIHI